jgi:hypothetical protein
MKKFLTLLFAFTCLAFSEMRGQNVFLTVGSPFIKMQTTDGILYSLTIDGNGGTYNSFTFIESNSESPFPALSYLSTPSFPVGIASSAFSSFGEIFNGAGFTVKFNKFTKEYSFGLNFGSYFSNGGSYLYAPSINGNACKLEVISNGFSNYQWRRNGVDIPGANQSTYFHPSGLNDPEYTYDCSTIAIFPWGDTATLVSNQIIVKTATPTTSLVLQTSDNQCDQRRLVLGIGRPYTGWVVEWKKNGQIVNGVSGLGYAPPVSNQDAVYSARLTCPNNSSINVLSNNISIPGCYADSTSGINYMLVQNVTTAGNNASNKTIQVQFDLSWGKTWWDEINWDAVWVFIKYKTASGEWKHAKINPTGYDHGQGSPNIIQPTADKMGAFIRLGLKGQGNFNAEGMQLQWNYGLDGLNSVNGLEVKVFAIEMVYQPQGDFSVSRDFSSIGDFTGLGDWSDYDLRLSASGNNIVVVNTRLSPVVSNPEISLRIKGDAGLDRNKDGIVENTIYPTGYFPFYLFKYEMSEQQYADFLNCLTTAQISTIDIAGTSISLNQGQYYAAFPNRACAGSNANRLLAYADWSGLRPMSFLELHKSFNGANPPNQNYSDGYYPPKDASGNSGSGIFGVKDLTGNVLEPFIDLGSNGFKGINGDGQLSNSGNSNVAEWSPGDLRWGNFGYYNSGAPGFRLCRSAE